MILIPAIRPASMALCREIGTNAENSERERERERDCGAKDTSVWFSKDLFARTLYSDLRIPFKANKKPNS